VPAGAVAGDRAYVVAVGERGEPALVEVDDGELVLGVASTMTRPMWRRR
jgi:hypothetical protein